MTAVGTIKEIKDMEFRVGLTPSNVAQLRKAGHKVYVQKGAGIGSGFEDKDYKKAGASLCNTALQVAEKVDILIKVKEPQKSEYPLLRKLAGKTLFTYLHLAAAPKSLTLELLKHNILGIAYETVVDHGRTTLLDPMSRAAGILAVDYGTEYMLRKFGGFGKSLTSIAGVPPAQVTIVGAGMVGTTSAEVAAGRGARVTLMDINKPALDKAKKHLENTIGKKLTANVSFRNSKNKAVLEKELKKTDILIGAALVRGARAPIVVTRQEVAMLPKGSVVVDVAIDQGGCIWGAKGTTHSHPTYKLLNSTFCCITNMPSDLARHTSVALTNATLPHLLKMAKLGPVEYCKKNRDFALGVNTKNGVLHEEHVATALGLVKRYAPLDL